MSSSNNKLSTLTYLRESTVVPDVTLVGEAVTNESKLALLGILLDGVEGFFLADLLFAFPSSLGSIMLTGYDLSSALYLLQA